MKTKLEIIRINEDVISTSLCAYYKTRGAGRAPGHVYCYDTSENPIPYYYKSDLGLLKKDEATPGKQNEVGWYHFVSGTGYVKCDVGNEGHPHVD